MGLKHGEKILLKEAVMQDRDAVTCFWPKAARNPQAQASTICCLIVSIQTAMEPYPRKNFKSNSKLAIKHCFDIIDSNGVGVISETSSF